MVAVSAFTETAAATDESVVCVPCQHCFLGLGFRERQGVREQAGCCFSLWEAAGEKPQLCFLHQLTPRETALGAASLQ